MTKNFKIRKLSKKLNYIKVKLFFVKKTKRLINYELNLLKNVKIFLIFYILLLKLANLITFIQDTFIFIRKKKINSKLKKFYNKKIKSILLSKKNTLF